MHCVDLTFPGITTNGGFAEYLLTGERAIIKLPDGLEPKAIAPYADAGITAPTGPPSGPQSDCSPGRSAR